MYPSDRLMVDRLRERCDELADMVEYAGDEIESLPEYDRSHGLNPEEGKSV